VTRKCQKAESRKCSWSWYVVFCQKLYAWLCEET